VTVVEPLPDGVVTFLLTDIEGSTALWDQHPEQMAKALIRHEDVIADVVHAHNGRLLKSRGEGDATLSVFLKATDAVAAAVALQRRLQNEPWPGGLDLATRVALHTGEAHLRDGDYYGGALNRAARIRGLAAGGQVLASRAVHDLVIDVLAPELELVGVGEHTMKGLLRTENVYAIRGPGLDLQVARSREDVIARPRTSFVGRSSAIEHVERALHDPGLVTLVGAGGIGKTRLLEEACVRFADRFERVWRIDLVAARGRASVEAALEGALLPARDPMMESSDSRPRVDILTEVASRLEGRRSLIALDNCEQLIDVLSDIVETLLDRARTLTVLATSREPVGARGEVVIPITPLQLPSDHARADAARLQHVESVDLLLARARDCGAELTITAESADDIASICRQLDGIPLALELAAARLASTSVHDLRIRLSRQLEVLAAHGRDPRHRTLRSAIDWSYELLEPAQRTLLRRLGIFVGGFTLDAAEEICPGEEDADLLSPGDAVYRNLAELVSKSLVVFERERGRYRLLEPIRQYACELLEQSPEMTPLSARHARWVLRKSRETLATQLLGNGAAADNFRTELDNVHAAIEWTFNHREIATGLRIVAALGFVWFQTEWRRGRVIAERAVELAGDASMRLRAAVLLSRGIVEQRADLGASTSWLTEARSLYLEIGDDFGVAWATCFLARSYTERSDEQATQLMHEALTRFESLELPLGQAWALAHLGAITNWQDGRLDQARTYLERALEPAQKTGQNAIIGVILGELGVNALFRGDLIDARATFETALELHEHGGDLWTSMGLLMDAAWVEVAADQLDDAERLLQRALSIAIAMDDEFQLREALLVAAVIRARQHDTDTAHALFAASRFDVENTDRFRAREHSRIGGALRQLDALLDETHPRRATQPSSSLEAARLLVSSRRAK
jgi:predicted ATPase/class 3 adenylate cyclase